MEYRVEDIREKVIKHDFAIKEIAKSMHDLTDTSKEANKKLGQIANSMGKQELILEKLANLEVNSADSINRVHRRIDGIEADVKKYAEIGNGKGCTALQLSQGNVKSNQKRIDKIDSTVTWISRTIIGTLITSAIGILFYIAKG